MKTLADEILAALPALCIQHPPGPLARDVAKRLAADLPSVRAAFEKLEADGRAKIVRRKRALHLVQADYPGRICPVCRAEYALPKKSKRRTCSRSCGVRLSWQDSVAAENRKAGIRASKQTPEARAQLEAHNRRRWSKPEEHQKLAEQNRREWTDPVKKAKRSVGIRRAHGTPEKRKFYSDLRKQMWRDPEYRAKCAAAAKRAKQRPSYKAKMKALMEARWRDPVLREKYLAATRINSAKARAANKGRKQKPGHIIKRITSRRRTMMEALL